MLRLLRYCLGLLCQKLFLHQPNCLLDMLTLCHYKLVCLPKSRFKSVITFRWSELLNTITTFLWSESSTSKASRNNLLGLRPNDALDPDLQTHLRQANQLRCPQRIGFLSVHGASARGATTRNKCLFCSIVFWSIHSLNRYDLLFRSMRCCTYMQCLLSCSGDRPVTLLCNS